jgi:hypothetical protein
MCSRKVTKIVLLVLVICLTGLSITVAASKVHCSDMATRVKTVLLRMEYGQITGMDYNSDKTIEGDSILVIKDKNVPYLYQVFPCEYIWGEGNGMVFRMTKGKITKSNNITVVAQSIKEHLKKDIGTKNNVPLAVLSNLSLSDNQAEYLIVDCAGGIVVKCAKRKKSNAPVCEIINKKDPYGVCRL